MSKKDKLEKENVALNSDDKKVVSKEKQPKEGKAKKKKEPKSNAISRKTKETVSELKKVVWPTFPTVVKRTGVVLAVVVIFAVILFGFDALLGWLFGLLT